MQGTAKNMAVLGLCDVGRHVAVYEYLEEGERNRTVGALRDQFQEV